MRRSPRRRAAIPGLSPRARALAIGVLALVGSAFLGGGCSGPILANPAPAREPGPPATHALAVATDPQPIRFPRDDGPHNRLTEWWYYTGHLVDQARRRYGFEFVVFRAERGSFPVSWASHLALTDETGNTFDVAQRSEVGAQVDRSPSANGEPVGFELAIGGADPSRPDTLGRSPWLMRRADGQDRLAARLSADEATAAGIPGGLGIDLRLAPSKPPVLHGGDGWIDFGPAGGSYYYSRTALTAAGTLDLDGRTTRVSGTAWFDHQWGDFIAVGAGGWDWFALNLSDGTDLMISLVRAADGTYPVAYGTLVDAVGHARPLGRNAFSVRVTGRWQSPRTGAVYPAGWTVTIPGERLRIDLIPTVADQELDTRQTTGVVYWEGSQTVRATRAGRPLGGEAYVELTGYAR